MKKITTLALLIFVSSCIYAQKPKQQPIVGTWQLIDFADFDYHQCVGVSLWKKSKRLFYLYSKRRTKHQYF